MQPSNRALPQWTDNVKKWMGQNGAMTNLQKDFVFYIEDTLVQPFKKEALRQKQKAELMELKNKELLETISILTEKNASLKQRDIKALTEVGS